MAAQKDKRTRSYRAIYRYPLERLSGTYRESSVVEVLIEGERRKNSRELGNIRDALDCNLDRRVETLMISCATKLVFPLLNGGRYKLCNRVTQFQRSCLSGVEFHVRAHYNGCAR